MQCRIQLARSAQILAAVAPAWEVLAAEALEPNPFYEPWILLPALRAQGERGFCGVLVWHGRSLIGLFPFQRVARFRGLPVTALASWRHSVHLMCAPLVHRDCAAESLGALFRWLKSDGAPVVELRYLPSDGAFHAALGDALAAEGARFVVTQSFERALLRRAPDADAYAAAAFSAQLRKSLRRGGRKLRESGPVSEIAIGPGGSLGEEIERFLELEASGWKGREGGALASSPASLRFGRAVLQEAHRRGRLSMVGIDCGGRPVARRCSLLAGAGSYAFKTAYDESFAACSPGVLAEALSLRQFHALPDVAWMDSYTEPDNALVNRMWKDRRAIRGVAVGTTAWGALWVSMLPLLRWTARQLKAKAQTAAPHRLAA